jgi:predicted kinase
MSATFLLSPIRFRKRGARLAITGQVANLPALIVISGPPGSGKTTLAHKIAAAVGCPAICRDEIKEGMAYVTPDFVAGPGDELTLRTLPVFFAVVELLLRSGVTTVAEAAFQDRVWRPGYRPSFGQILSFVHAGG